MQDRVPLYPGRVKLIPVSGQENTYDMVRADEPTQEGTPLSKAAFLKDDTAALFGLDVTAVPDDALALLSRFPKGLGNEYVWAKYATVPSPVTEGDDLWITCYAGSSNSESIAIEYSDSAEIINNKVVLVNPSSRTISYSEANDYSTQTAFSGEYIKCVDTDGVEHIVVGASSAFNCNFDGSTYRIYVIGKNVVVGTALEFSEYVNSDSKNAYPPAVSDGYTYVLLGQIGEKVWIATGTYKGTGTYGESNPNSLTFDFEPKLIFVQQGNQGSNRIIALNGCKKVTMNETSNETVIISWREKTVAWYNSSNTGSQLNNTNMKYLYIAIG